LTPRMKKGKPNVKRTVADFAARIARRTLEKKTVASKG